MLKIPSKTTPKKSQFFTAPIDYTTAKSFIVDKVEDEINSDKKLVELDELLKQLSIEKLAPDELLQFYRMQLRFLNSFKESKKVRKSSQKFYTEFFNEAIDEILSNRKINFQISETNSITDEELKLSIIEQYSAFKACPINKESNLKEWRKLLIAEHDRLRCLVVNVVNEIEPLELARERLLQTLINDKKPSLNEEINHLKSEFKLLENPIEKFCKAGELDSLKNLFAKMNEKEIKDTINTQNAQGDFPLLISCLYGHDYIIEYLLQLNADPQVKDAMGYGAFHAAVLMPEEKDVFKCLRLLRQAGLDVDLQTKEHGRTALHRAAYHGNIKALKWLLKNGASINIQESECLDKATALHYACIKGHLHCVKELLVFNADPKLLTKEGETALVSAIIQYYFERDSEKKYHYHSIIDTFIDNGIVLSQEDLAYLNRYESKHGLSDLTDTANQIIQSYYNRSELLSAIDFRNVPRKKTKTEFRPFWKKSNKSKELFQKLREREAQEKVNEAESYPNSILSKAEKDSSSSVRVKIQTDESEAKHIRICEP